MHMHGHLIQSLATALIGIFCVTVGLGGAAQAQTPTLVQPWGLPPLPPGVGPVEKFADVSGTPQGQFLEGGAFDTHGNLWFVAIGSGWVSYLTPDGTLVPGFNCNPPPELGQTCEPQGTRWLDGKLYVATRHRGILVYDPQTEGTEDPGLYLPQPAVQRAQRPRFRRRGEPLLHRPVGDRPGAEPDRPNGRRIPVLARRDAAQGHGQWLVPERHCGVAGQHPARGRRFSRGPDLVQHVPKRSNDGLPAMPEGPVTLDLQWGEGRDLSPGNGGPDGMHYDVRGHLWVAVAGLGGMVQVNPRGLILGFVPIPNDDAATTNFAFGGPDNQYIYVMGASTGTFWRFKAPYPGLIGPGGVRLPAQR